MAYGIDAYYEEQAERIADRPNSAEKNARAQWFLTEKARFFLRRAEAAKDASVKLDLLFASKAMTDAVRILQDKRK